MKDIPFFPNTSDDTHCVQACFRMVLKYFLPAREFSWEELDHLTQKQEGKGTWWFPALKIFNDLGISSKLIGSFDYQRFYEEGDVYLKSIMSEEQLNYYANKSNLFSVKDQIPEFIKNAAYEKRQATLKDIDELLEQVCLVGIELDACVLSKNSGFSPHMVLVFGKIKTEYFLHDPGLPPMPNRKVTVTDLESAWGEGGKEKRSLVAFRSH